MNTLLIDAGNSRIKWALLRDGQLGRIMATPLKQLEPLRTWLARAPKIDAAIGVCVAGERVERTLRGALRRTGHAPLRFVHSATNAAGVRNGYRDAWRLGDDRWVGAIAAWHLAGCYRTVCAVSVGTAVTIDLVDCDGQHRGGLIAPGPALMVQSLLGNTRGIASRATRSTARKQSRTTGNKNLIVRPLADNTHDAITLGSLAAVAALIDTTVTRITRELGVRPVVFLTGGGADAVAPLLKGACKLRDDLNLRGVAAIAGAHIQRRA